MNTLIDLDELVLRCRDDQAKSYIQEAVACYKTGAIRSCIVSTWIAVVFDFLHKLGELELTGDKNAKKKLEQFEQIRAGGESRLKEALEFERDVLNVAATEFELLTPLEKDDLLRLYHDRNRCAHPSMQSFDDPYQPTAELARTHLRNAVEILLQREPVQGTAAFDRICREIKSEYFPTQPEAVQKHLEGGPLKRARKPLIRRLIVGLTKSYLTDDLPDAERLRVLAALSGVLGMYVGVGDEVLTAELPAIVDVVTDDNLWRVIAYVAKLPSAWERLGEAARGKAKNYLSSVPRGQDAFVRSLSNGFLIPALKEIAINRIESADVSELAAIIQIHPRAEYAERAVKGFANASSFRGAEWLGNALLLPIAPVLTPEQISAALSAVMKNGQIWYASGMMEILFKLFELTRQHQIATASDWQSLIAFLTENAGNMGTVAEPWFDALRKAVSQAET